MFSSGPAVAAPLTTFAPLFEQVTNDLAQLQSSFGGSAAQKQRLGLLAQSRSAVLDAGRREDQVLARLVTLLGTVAEYADTLDQSAINARASVLADYHALSLRVSDLPPSYQATLAKTRFNALAADFVALLGAAKAANISALLAPFGSKTALVNRLVARAATMRAPAISLNSVRATVNGRSFVSSGDGPHSPNSFSVNAPTAAYREVYCRVVDRAKVLSFTLPAVTSLVRYDASQGLAAVTFLQDVFAPDGVNLSATAGTFWVQSDRNEVFGLFSCSGPGLVIKDGRFRIRLRGN